VEPRNPRERLVPLGSRPPYKYEQVKLRRVPNDALVAVGAAGFTSLEAARNFLTRERLALLRAIKSRHPGSIYALARMVDRDLKNVQEDIRILERHGLVKTTARPRGSRTIKVPEVPFEEIALHIAI